MLNLLSCHTVQQAVFRTIFRLPCYQNFCFSNIPNTIRALFGIHNSSGGLPLNVLPRSAVNPQKVVLLLIDGFGWRYYEAFRNRLVFFKRIKEQAVISKLTSQFPSTTASQVTCIHTGKTVSDTGIYEWFHYDPVVDRVICPLMFSLAGDEERDTLLALGVAPESVFPAADFYSDLQNSGVAPFVFQPAEYAFGPYNSVVCRDASIVPYSDSSEGLQELAEKVLRHDGRGYFYYYYDDFDAYLHQHGPDCSGAAHEAARVWRLIQQLTDQLRRHATQTLLLITADHGQAATPLERTIYLDLAIPELPQWIETNQQGELIVPAGSPRDFFLHLRPDCLKEAREKISSHLKNKAEVLLLSELGNAGVFGAGGIGRRLAERAGNLVVLPHEPWSVFWSGNGKFTRTHLGNHGGLSPKEMEVPLFALWFE